MTFHALPWMSRHLAHASAARRGIVPLLGGLLTLVALAPRPASATLWDTDNDEVANGVDNCPGISTGASTTAMATVRATLATMTTTTTAPQMTRSSTTTMG